MKKPAAGSHKCRKSGKLLACNGLDSSLSYNKIQIMRQDIVFQSRKGGTKHETLIFRPSDIGSSCRMYHINRMHEHS